MRTPTPSPEALDTSRTIRRMQAAMHVLLVLLLAVGAARALVTGAHTAARVVLLLAGTGLFAALYVSGLGLERRARRADAGAAARNGHVTQVWVAALVAGWVLLLGVAHDFAWVAFALYFLVLHVARRALAVALVLVVFVASVAALNLDASTRGPGSVAGPFIGMLVALGIAWVYAQLQRENAARTSLVTRLFAAQEDVLATQEELALAQHQAGVLAERERLARDIHDTLAQGFSSILLLSRAGLAREPDATLLRQIEQTAGDGLTQAREVVHALAPTELTESPLASALERLGARLGEQGGVHVTAAVEGAARTLPVDVDVALLRIAQGALANVRLHARAGRAAITLRYETDAVTLEIIDDGVGFHADALRPFSPGGGGFGLRAIRERAEAAGGSLTLESAPGDGTAVVVTLPTRERS